MVDKTMMATHPDLIELRERYDMASARPVAEITEGLTLLAAAYLAASPWIVDFRALPTITVNNLIAGGILVVLAIGLSGAYGRLHGLTWVVPVIGCWTIVAPWLMAGAVDTTRTIWSNAFAGGAIVALGLLMTVFGMLRARRFSG